MVVDWQEPMVLQRKLRPSIARFNGQLDQRHAASKHATVPINHTRPSSRKHSPDGPTRARKQTCDYNLLLIYRPRKYERRSWRCWLTYIGWFTLRGHPPAAGRAQDRESLPVQYRRSTTLPRHQLVRLDHEISRSRNVLLMPELHFQRLCIWFRRRRINSHLSFKSQAAWM